MMDRWEAFRATSTDATTITRAHVIMATGFVLAYLLAVTASTIAIASVL